MKKIFDFSQQYNMLPHGASVIVCVSGGTDSMCLLNVLNALKERLGLRLAATHYNHRLRGAESDGDETFVREYCERMGVPLYTGSGDVAGEAARLGLGIEETARRMRYAFFSQLSEKLGGAKIATAHNSDDNLETILMRIARGTGLRGLCGIPPVNGNIIRPILCLTRGEIESWSRENRIPHREDSTNASDDYTRNLIRHSILPVMRKINPAVNVTELTALLREDEGYLDTLAEDFLRGQEKEGSLPVTELLALPKAVSSRVIRKFCGAELSASHVDSVYGLLKSPDPSARLSLPGLTLRREYGSLTVSAGKTVATFAPRALEIDSNVIIGEASLRISARKSVYCGGFYNSLTSFPVNSDKITGELIVRPRMAGDVIKLSGGKRTLKKLFIDRHIPRFRRGLVPVIADSRGVIAVCGIGMDTDYLPAPGEAAVIIETEKN